MTQKKKVNNFSPFLKYSYDELMDLIKKNVFNIFALETELQRGDERFNCFKLLVLTQKQVLVFVILFLLFHSVTECDEPNI